MKTIKVSFLAAAVLLLFSCKKETGNSNTIQSSGTLNQSVAAQLRWQGVFISENGLPPSRNVQDKIFIKDGAARIYSEAISIDENNHYSTRIRLVIPTSVMISGDSLNLEAGVKNPANSTFYDPSFGRDVTLYLQGATNAAYINNTATTNVDPSAPKRAAIKLGQTVRNNLSFMQYNFEEYGTFILQTFNRGVVAYRNNEYLGGLGYGDEPVIGKLKEIGITFKGSGYIDYIKLYNSATGKLLLSEDFNTDGKSTIIINP